MSEWKIEFMDEVYGWMDELMNVRYGHIVRVTSMTSLGHTHSLLSERERGERVWMHGWMNKGVAE